VLKSTLLILFFTLPSYVVAADRIMKCPIGIYKMTEKWFGMRKEFYRTFEKSPDGWKPICRTDQDRTISEYRVTCSTLIEHRINFDKTVAKVRRYMCRPDDQVPARSNIENLLEQYEDPLYENNTEADRRERFKNNNCVYYGPHKTIYADEIRFNNGVWNASLFPDFHPFDEGTYRSQILGYENYGGSATRWETIIDFEIPREIRNTIELDPISMEQIGEKTTVLSCKVE